MVQSVSRSPRAWLAVVGVLALLAAGLPSAAHAAGEDVIIGTVVVPAGVDVDDLVVEAYRADGESWRRATWADPEVDGSFALTGLATDLGYRVRVLSYDDGYAGGFYAGAGSQPGRGPDDGVSVRTGHAGITLSLITTVALTATYTLPPGFEWRSVWDTKDRLVSFAAEEYALDGTGWRSKSVWATVGRDGDGTVTFTGLRPDAGYRIRASDTDLSYAARFPKGYYREGVGTLIEREEFATPVRIGQTPHLNIGWTLVQPKPNLVAAPQLSGQAVVGSAVTASTGTWDPADVDVAYEWLRDGVVVPGAAGPQLALTAADAGASIAVRVTASRQYFDARSATSAATRVAGLAAPRAKSSP
ncbi:MAG: hypothetical protein M3Y20_07350, partial [Actinomycetota bacterium]|nr:hypothetical protein [Actinomycetota bacterium]